MGILLKELLYLLAVLVLIYLFFFYFYKLPRFFYLFFKKIRNPTKKDRILVLAPHPDDESLGCFAYLNKAKKVGAKIRVLVFTDGYFLANPERRYSEVLTTLSKINILKKDVKFLGFRDIHLRKVYYCSDILAKEIKDFKPTIIFSTSKYDSNPDHKALYYHLKKALEKAKTRAEIYYYLIHYKLKFYPLPTGLKENENLYPPMPLLLKNNLEWYKLELNEKENLLKKEAILNYKSQLRMQLFLTRRTLFSFIRKNELFFKEKI
ncbi:MAG: PIG-L family deacetylase [Candidatus Pacearchaeota archaeon]